MTIIGGLLFLLPIVLVSIILGYAMQLAGKVAPPIAKLLPDAVVGLAGITVVAAMVLVLFSCLAGLVARTATGARTMRQFENSILGNLPQYQLMKSMAEGLAKVESTKGMKPVLVSVEGVGRLDTFWRNWKTAGLPYSYRKRQNQCPEI